MRLSGIRWTWPHQRSCDNMSIASMPVILQQSRISVLGSRSCHFVFEILRRQFMWKLSSFFMWRRYGVHVSLPYSRDERIAVRYTWVFVSSRIPRSFHNRLDSWPKAAPALANLSVSSSSSVFYTSLGYQDSKTFQRLELGHC